MPGTTRRKAIRLTQEELMALVAGRSDAEIAAHIRNLAAAHRPPRLINNDTVLNMAEWGCRPSRSPCWNAWPPIS
jgi:hypothetical protein